MTVALPPALAAWEPHLRLFPDDLIAALAPLAQRLDAALGPMRTRDRVDEGDPDGFSDIGRRGPYDRLLLSEWLLAEDAPDEFLRRAAMGEHGFLQLARRTRTGGRISFALFDAGPSQLGGPRIAHLALLVVLARRAEAAKARFQWAILQNPDAEPTVGLSESSIRALLLARTGQTPTAAMWDRWRTRAAAQSDVDDFWSIGGDRLAQLAAHDGVSHVAVRDELDPETHRISAQIHRPGRAGARILLDLPTDAVCTRLLRDPFAAAVVAPVRAKSNVAPASNLLFTASGSKVIARAGGGGLIAYPVPNSPRSGPGYPKQYELRTKDTILAAGRIGKAYVVVTRPAPEILLVSCIGGKNGNVAAGGYTLSQELQQSLDTFKGSPLLPCFASPSSLPLGCRQIVCLPERPAMPGRCTIVLLSGGGDGREIERLYGNAAFAALTRSQEAVFYGLRTNTGWKIELDGDPTRYETAGVHESYRQGMYFGYGGDQEDPSFGLVAAHANGNHWTVMRSQGKIVLNAIPECEVVGVIAVRRYETPALVMLEPGARRIRIMSTAWSHILPVTNAPIEHVTVSHTAPVIAYATSDGELIVYSLEHEAVLYRLSPERSGA